MIRPSSLPIIALSPLFQSSGDTDWTMAGTMRHTAFKAALQGNRELLDALTDDDREGTEWAVDYVKANASSWAHLVLEEKSNFTGPDFEQIEGTPDAHTVSEFSEFPEELFDLKWRFADYRLQMMAYALMKFEHSKTPPPNIHVHVLFAEAKKADSYFVTEDECRTAVYAVIERAKSATRCHTSQYCCRCARVMHCQEYIDQVNHVAAGRGWELAEFHSSSIQDPIEMGKALKLSRALKQWCKSVEFHAKNMVTKQGMTPAGFATKTTKGKAYVSDAAAAFSCCGLPQEEFLKCCALRLNSSKKYPDQVGAVDLYSKFTGIKKAPAKRKLVESLGDLVKHGNDSFKLVAVDGDNDESQEE